MNISSLETTFNQMVAHLDEIENAQWLCARLVYDGKALEEVVEEEHENAREAPLSTEESMVIALKKLCKLQLKIDWVNDMERHFKVEKMRNLGGSNMVVPN